MRKSHKEELFSAAFRLFILHGYDGVSFSDIEKATGMSRGAIFHYVNTKQDLFRQVVEMFVIDKQSIDMKIKYGKDPLLRDFIGAYAQGVKRTMKEVRQIIGEDVSMAAGSRAYLNIIQQVATLVPDLFKLYQQCMDREQQVWQQVITRAIERKEIQPGIDVELLAQSFIALFYGRAYRDSLSNGLDADLLKRQMLQLYEVITFKNKAQIHGMSEDNYTEKIQLQEIDLLVSEDRVRDINVLLEDLTIMRGAEFIRQLKEITNHPSFYLIKDETGIYITGGEKGEDYDNLLNAARKAVEHGYRVFILPNPKGFRTADYIFERKGVFKMFDLKTILGKASAGTRLKESIGQTNHVILNLATNYDPRMLAKDVRDYFEANKQAREVLIMKGNRQLSVSRRFVEGKDYIKMFIKRFLK